MGYGNLLVIDSVNVPDPSKLDLDYEDIHSEDSGRNEKGDMIVRIVARKRKLNLEWHMLSYANGKLLLELFKTGPYHSVTYFDAENNVSQSGTFYVGSRSASMYNHPKQAWETIKFNLIQK